jgi:hypothetical protein
MATLLEDLTASRTPLVPVPQNTSDQQLTPMPQKTTPTTTAPTTKTTSNEPSYKLNANFSGDKREARIAAVKNPKVINPLVFTNPTDRYAATFARAQRIVGDSKFKALPPEHQQKVLSNYYDKYVKPAYENNGLHAPNKDLWVRTMPKNAEGHGATDVDSFYLDKKARAVAITAASTESSAGELASGISYAGIGLSKAATKTFLHLSNFFGAPVSPAIQQSQDEMYAKAKGAADKINNAVFDNANFWLQTHPSKSWVDHVDAGVGEALIQLPLYEAIGAARVGVAAKASDMLGAGKIANLTGELGKSKAGAFVARRLGEATDAYMGGLLQNSQHKVSDMLSFMGFGAALEGAGAAISYPSKMLLKKFTARTVAMGGKPLQEAVTDEAAHELENGIHSTEANLIEHLKTDPVKGGLVTAEKMTLTAMGKQKYGKVWNQLSHSQRNSIRAVRQQLTEESIAELPLHEPEIAQANAQKQLQESAKENPKLAARMVQFEQQFKMSISKASVDAEASQLKNQVGVNNAQDVISKIGNKSKPKFSKAQLAAQELEPKKFAQLKMDTLAYFKNPYSKQAVQSKDLHKWLDGLSDEDFTQDLQDEMGAGKYKFEDPDHALLWANHFKKDIPTPMRNKLIQVLHDRYPSQTVAEWNRASENLERHMDYLSITGRLESQKNIFHTTQVADWANKTKYQKQLKSEVEQVEFQHLTKQLQGHPEVQTQALKVLKQLQLARRVTDTPEMDRLLTKQISMYDAARATKRAKRTVKVKD